MVCVLKLTWVVVLIVLSLANPSFGSNLLNRKGCVSSFNSHRYFFDVCITHECLVFRVEEPFVFVDPGMSSVEHEKPFRCKDRKKIWSQLRGAQFDITDEMNSLSESYCVWAGPNCGFDDMIGFINRTSRETYHRFIAAGLLFNLRYRISEHSLASEPLTDDELHIVGPLRDTTMTLSVAWDTMWAPFTPRAWYFLFGSVCAVAILRVLVSLTFTRPLELGRIISNTLGDYDRETQLKFNGDLEHTGNVILTRDPSPNGHRLATLKRLNNNWANASKVGFLIMILYYEVALILSDAEPELPFADLQPTRFVVIANSTEEYVTNEIFRGNNGARRWEQRTTIGEVYKDIMDPNNDARFTVSYEKFNRHMFRQQPERCAFSQIYNTKNQMEKLPRLNGVWYYSQNVDLIRRTQIDSDIMKLRESGRIDRISNVYFGNSLPTKCTPPGSRITFPLLALPLVFLPGPIFFFVFLNLLVYYFRKISRQLFPTKTRLQTRNTDEQITQTEMGKRTQSITEEPTGSSETTVV